jgi:hypothetical protein
MLHETQQFFWRSTDLRDLLVFGEDFYIINSG